MQENTYETSDFYLAVTLLSLGYVIVNFDATDMSRIVFIFEKKEGILKDVEGFWTGRQKVNPKVLFMLQKELKGRMNQIIR